MSTIVRLNMTDIDPEDRLYAYSTVRDVQSLAASMEAVGQLNPLHLQGRGDGRYRIVCGFRRHAALRSLKRRRVEAIVHGVEGPAIELFESSLRDNLSVRRFNALEISRIVNRLHSRFSVEPPQILSRYLPMLGLANHPVVLSIYAPLIELDEAWQRALENDELSVELAAAAVPYPRDERDAFFHLIESLKLGVNRQREFWRLLTDLHRRDGISIREILASEPMRAVLEDTDRTSTQKADLLKHRLLERRYPRSRAALDRFQTVLRRAKCPAKLSIRPPANFEGEEYTVSFKFRDEKEYREMCDTLRHILDDRVIADLLQCANG